MSYGYTETNFARHIQRACYYNVLRRLSTAAEGKPDRAAITAHQTRYELLSPPDVRSMLMQKVFGPQQTSAWEQGAVGLPGDGNDARDVGAWQACYTFVSRSRDPAAAIAAAHPKGLAARRVGHAEFLTAQDVERHLGEYGVDLKGNPNLSSMTVAGMSYSIDLTQLTSFLSERAVCLGSSPGFQKADVLKAVSFAAFTPRSRGRRRPLGRTQAMRSTATSLL